MSTMLKQKCSLAEWEKNLKEEGEEYVGITRGLDI